LAPTDAGAVGALIRRVTEAKGSEPVDAGRLRQAFAGEAPGFFGALAWDADHAELAGYAQAVRGGDAWSIDVAVRAAAPATIDTSGLAVALARAVQGAAAGEDDAPQRLWAFHADERSDRLAEALGLVVSREILQLRCRLPLGPEVKRSAVATRPFTVGQDEVRWLELNRRAFAWHPEQGAMTMADLRAREQEPWFDPEGFLIHERAGALVGFCWTKVHEVPPLGEIYVIGVDPDAQGEGLGRGLVVAGLDHLARAGLTAGMLYVEATNEPALRLYDDLGFAVHQVDRVYS
jgi:mycothiol synthase